MREIFILVDNPEDGDSLKRAEKLSSFLKFPIIFDKNKEKAKDLILIVGKEGLSLESIKRRFVLWVDFLSLDVSSKIGSKKNQPLIKAVGVKRQTIFDLTAGFGKDSWILASFGHRIIAFEKNKLIFTILKEALSRAAIERMEIALRIRPIWADSLTVLKKFSCLSQKFLLPYPDVVYIDPFLPKKSMKKRLPKKYIQILRTVGQEEDSSIKLIEEAFKIANKKVVVKRSLKYNCCKLDLSPTYQVKGKGFILDVYVIG